MGTYLKGWIELCCDLNWEDYHGMWARFSKKENAWYVLQWTNLLDAAGDDFEDTPFECQVKRLVFAEIPTSELIQAMKSSGLRIIEGGILVNDQGDELGKRGSQRFDLARLEACISYGLGAPLETVTGRTKPRSIRAQAKRFAEACMKDAAMLEERLERPVNAIGSTAREYGVGDINSALYRGENTPAKRILRIMSGDRNTERDADRKSE